MLEVERKNQEIEQARGELEGKAKSWLSHRNINQSSWRICSTNCAHF